MTPEQLDELERLEKAATPGPWFLPIPEEHLDSIGYDGGMVAELRMYRLKDSNLIVALRNAAPALIAAAREGGAREIEAVNARSDRDRLQARVAELEARLEKVGKLLSDAMLLLGKSSNSSANYDDRAEACYRDTHVMAPGKSEPLEWGGRWTPEQRQEVWFNWYESRLADLRAAFAALTPPEAAAGKDSG